MKNNLPHQRADRFQNSADFRGFKRLYFVYLITLLRGVFGMNRSTSHSDFIFITILSNNCDDGLAGDSRAVSTSLVSNLKPLNFQYLPSIDDTPIEWTEHILNCTQIGLSFAHLNDYPEYREMAKDDFGFMSPCGPVHGMVRWTGGTIGTMTKHKAETLRPINISI